MIIITHHDTCRDTVQLVHACNIYAGETAKEYRARLLPIAQAHEQAMVDLPGYVNWEWWIKDGYALDEANDEFYACTHVWPFRRFERAFPIDSLALTVVSEEQATKRIVERREWQTRQAERFKDNPDTPRGGRRSDNKGNDD
jgi:hypothetical protein